MRTDAGHDTHAQAGHRLAIVAYCVFKQLFGDVRVNQFYGGKMARDSNWCFQFFV